MPTIRQERLAEAIIESSKTGEPKTAEALAVKVGYSPVTAQGKAGELIRSNGVQEALENRGFTAENAKRVVTEILNKGRKEEARLKAADMVFKVQGSYAPEKTVSLNVNLNDTKDFDSIRTLAKRFEDDAKT